MNLQVELWNFLCCLRLVGLNSYAEDESLTLALLPCQHVDGLAVLSRTDALGLGFKEVGQISLHHSRWLGRRACTRYARMCTYGMFRYTGTHTKADVQRHQRLLVRGEQNPLGPMVWTG